MPFDYLTMCSNVASMAGLSGQISGVTGQTGDLNRITRLVREACTYVESLWGDWKFLYGGPLPLVLQEGIAIYSVPSVYSLYRWNKDAMYIDGHHIPRCNVFEYHERPIREGDLFEGRPVSVVIRPDNSLQFINIPDQSYNFTADYYKRPMLLVNNTDLPNVPQIFCPVIEAEALRRYANYDNAVELKTEAQESFMLVMQQLENDQRPGGTVHNTSYGDHVTMYSR